MRDARRLTRMEPVPAVRGQTVHAKLLKGSGAVHLGRNATLGQEISGGHDLLQDRATADEPDRVTLQLRLAQVWRLEQPVDAL